MIACTRCGHWHTDAERVLGRDLSCSEVKRFWSKLRKDHKESTGHLAQITSNDKGELVCLKCHAKLG